MRLTSGGMVAREIARELGITARSVQRLRTAARTAA